MLRLSNGLYANLYNNSTVRAEVLNLVLQNDLSLQNCRHITQFNSECAPDSQTVIWYSGIREKCVLS